MIRQIRGSGFRHTLPAVYWYSAIWVVIVVLTAPILIIGMVVGDIIPPELHSEIWFFLFTRVPIIAVVAIGIAIFTTTRVAGPMIPLMRAFKRVEQGDTDYRIRFRDSDKHLRELELAFNAMMQALSDRAESADDPASTGTPAPSEPPAPTAPVPTSEPALP